MNALQAVNDRDDMWSDLLDEANDYAEQADADASARLAIQMFEAMESEEVNCATAFLTIVDIMANFLMHNPCPECRRLRGVQMVALAAAIVDTMQEQETKH